jgi:MarR family transcriptional regulator, organic hydroperoxide resistance regulator
VYKSIWQKFLWYTALMAIETPQIPIEDYLCLALYSASRSVTALYRDLLSELRLTYPQYLVMRVLWQKGPQPVKEIASVLQLDYGTLSPLLKRLEAADLVTRSRRPDDERSVEIALTHTGEAMRDKAEDVPARLTAALDLDERTTKDFIETLKHVTQAANSHHEAPPVA